MNDLTFTQEYTLCVLNQRGTLSSLRKLESSTCFVASCLWELLFDNVVALDEKGKIIIKTELPSEMEYLRPLYNTIEARPRKPKALVQDYVAGMTAKKREALIESVISYLVKKEILIVDSKQGLIGEKKQYIPKEGSVDSIVEKIRTEFLAESKLSDEVAILGILLKESKLLKTFFSKYESDKFNKRIKELKNNPSSPFIRDIINQIELSDMIAAYLVLFQ